jgi:ABC-type cobalamin/Fe3+-siderophores transport system ATPase subunit
MKLKSAHVTNFRSAENSEPFSLNSVTCLVGKNESGKSAVLLALAALNPHASTPVVLDKERDYPRRFLTAYIERHRDAPAIAISTIWEITPEELQAVEAELGHGVLRSNAISIQRSYSQEPEWKPDIDFRKAFENVLGTAFDEEQKAELASSKNTAELIKKLSELKRELLSNNKSSTG